MQLFELLRADQCPRLIERIVGLYIMWWNYYCIADSEEEVFRRWLMKR